MTGLEACLGAAQHALCFPPATPYAKNNSYNKSAVVVEVGVLLFLG